MSRTVTSCLPRSRLWLRAGSSVGTLVDRSQQAAEDLLGNQVPETVALARLARELGAHAASSFGAGFGGSVWALVDALRADAFKEDWLAAYAARHPAAATRAEAFLARPGPGAGTVELTYAGWVGLGRFVSWSGWVRLTAVGSG